MNQQEQSTNKNISCNIFTTIFFIAYIITYKRRTKLSNFTQVSNRAEILTILYKDISYKHQSWHQQLCMKKLWNMFHWTNIYDLEDVNHNSICF